jgi:thiosulfate reductase cytochrome b subunit
VGGLRIDTTGVLGASENMMGKRVARAFPTWATIPGGRNLAQGRRWHFFFAWVFVLNGLAYWLWSWRARHLREDLAPTGAELRGIGASIVEHAKFHHPTGEAATRYNVLQKLAYLAVIFVLAPGIVLMGLAMSPHMDSVLGWMVDLVGGRQSARTWHFIFCFAFRRLHRRAPVHGAGHRAVQPDSRDDHRQVPRPRAPRAGGAPWRLTAAASSNAWPWPRPPPRSVAARNWPTARA